jgi:hypothetical protein
VADRKMFDDAIERRVFQMKDICLFAVVLIASSAHGQTLPTPTVQPTPSYFNHYDFSRFVPSGEQRMINFYTSIWPDCTSRGPVVGRITTPPQHGALDFTPVDSFPSISPMSPLAKCNEKKIPGLGISYKSEPNYTGEDGADIFLIFPDGSAAESHYTIVVR